MFGRQAKLPVDFNAEPCYDPDQKLEQYHASADTPVEVLSMKHEQLQQTVKVSVLSFTGNVVVSTSLTASLFCRQMLKGLKRNRKSTMTRKTMLVPALPLAPLC